MVSSSGTISASFVSKRSRSPKTPPYQKLTLKVKHQGAEDLYKIRADAHLKKLMTAYCKKKHLDYNTVRFVYNEKEIKPRQTPAQLKMEEEDEICLLTDVDGG